MSEQAPVPQPIETKPQTPIVIASPEITPPPAPIPQPEKSAPPKPAGPEEKKLAPSPIKYTSQFTPQVAENLTSAGINIEYVNPTPIGKGANHMVYLYQEPGQPTKVIKLAKTKSLTTLTNGKANAEESTEIAKSYFGQYTASTEIKSGKDKFYCVIQELVEGGSLSNLNSKGDKNILNQLTKIVAMNNRLYREKNMCLDFVGLSGFKDWFKSQFKRLILGKSEFPVSNIIVDKNGRLKIIDFEYFDLRKKVNFGRRILYWISMNINRIFMKHYFGLDIKK